MFGGAGLPGRPAKNPSMPRWTPNHEEVAAKVIDGEAIVLNLKTSVYYSSDGAGALVWGLLEAGCDSAGIASAVAESYGIALETAKNDVDLFVSELLQENLILPASPELPPKRIPPVSPGAAPYQAPVLQGYRDLGELLAFAPLEGDSTSSSG